MKLVNPANKRKYKVIVVGSGLAGGACSRVGSPKLGYDVACFCFQDSPRRGTLDRGARRHQRCEELLQGTTATPMPSSVLRHGQGRRLSLARVERPPARRGLRRHHRSMHRDGRPVRARVRRHARESQLRRRAGVAHVLRTRSDRPAAAARRLRGDVATDRRRQDHDVLAHRAARRRARRPRPCVRHRRARSS